MRAAWLSFREACQLLLLVERRGCTAISSAITPIGTSFAAFTVEISFICYEFPLMAHLRRYYWLDREHNYENGCPARNLLNIIVGVVGAFLAGILLSPLLGTGTINQSNFSFPSLLVSLGGAIILLAIVNLFRRGTV